MQRIINFIKYHNAVPIALSVILLGSGAVFAASPEAREIIVSEETIVQSVDNSYIVSVDLEAHNPLLKIVSVEEDDSSYHVSYTYDTIAIDDYVWKEFETTETLVVSKAALGGRDLGLYVAEEISEVINREDEYLNKVQKIEKNNGVTKKVATTEYSGLVGKMLSADVEEFEGYVPVIDEPVAVIASVEEAKVSAQIATSNELSAQVAAAVPSKEEIKQIIQETVKELLAEANTTTVTATVVPTTATSTTTTQGGDTTPPVITIVGNNPAEIAVGASYVDLGATVTDDSNDNLGITYAVNGAEVSNISIDTSMNATHTIVYSATDQAGNIGIAERTVIVGTGVTEAVVETGTDTASTTTATTTPEAPVADTTPPVLTLLGEVTVALTEDETYTDAGATANDDTDGDITAEIVIVNPVDTTTPGVYTVTYDVTDASGNVAIQASRTVTVVEAPIVEPVVDETASTTPDTATTTSSQ